MEADFAAFGSPLCGEVKRFCRRVRETYREIQEELTPYKDDRYYRYCRGAGGGRGSVPGIAQGAPGPGAAPGESPGLQPAVEGPPPRPGDALWQRLPIREPRAPPPARTC